MKCNNQMELKRLSDMQPDQNIEFDGFTLLSNYNGP